MKVQKKGRHARAAVVYAREGESRLEFVVGDVQDTLRGDWRYVGLQLMLPTPAKWDRARDLSHEHDRQLRAAGESLAPTRSLLKRSQVARKASYIAAGLGWTLDEEEEVLLARMASDRTRDDVASVRARC